VDTPFSFAERGELKTINGVEAHYVKDVAGREVPSLFNSIFDGAWWFLVTGTSVGYGDVYPQTHLGRTIAMVAIMMGLIAVALPIGMIQAQFQILHFEEAQRLAEAGSEGDVSALGDLKRMLDRRDDQLLDKFVTILEHRGLLVKDVNVGLMIKSEDDFEIERIPSSENVDGLYHSMKQILVNFDSIMLNFTADNQYSYSQLLSCIERDFGKHFSAFELHWKDEVITRESDFLRVWEKADYLHMDQLVLDLKLLDSEGDKAQEEISVKSEGFESV